MHDGFAKGDAAMSVRQGIPFRPDPDARREATLTSIAKACLHLVRAQGDKRTRLDEVGELVHQSPNFADQNFRRSVACEIYLPICRSPGTDIGERAGDRKVVATGL
jgi:hypothetical protein